MLQVGICWLSWHKKDMQLHFDGSGCDKVHIEGDEKEGDEKEECDGDTGFYIVLEIYAEALEVV